MQTDPDINTDVGLRHDAFVYDSDEQFAAGMSRFLATGLEAGAAAVAVTSRGNWALLRDALGKQSAQVDFADRDDWYVRPAKALARYDAALRHHLSNGAPSVRLLAEVQFGPTESEWDEWTAYEAIANHAFAGRPAWIVCPYDTRVLPASVVDDAWRTHPTVMTAERRPSALYEGIEDFVRGLGPKQETLAGLEPLPHAPDAQVFRDLLASRLTEAGIHGSLKLDMLVAANEVFANGSSHGGGVLLVRTGRVDGRFVCEITDAGPGLDDPFAGYLPPKSREDPGAGLWVARQLTWRVDLITSSRGLTVRLWL